MVRTFGTGGAGRLPLHTPAFGVPRGPADTCSFLFTATGAPYNFSIVSCALMKADVLNARFLPVYQASCVFSCIRLLYKGIELFTRFNALSLSEFCLGQLVEAIVPFGLREGGGVPTRIMDHARLRPCRVRGALFIPDRKVCGQTQTRKSRPRGAASNSKHIIKHLA